MSTNPPRQVIRRQLLIAERLAAEPPAEGEAEAEAKAKVDPYTFDVVASDESVDSFGTIVRGFILDRFIANPVVLFAHDHTRIVGGASNVRHADGALRMTITLAEEGTSATVDEVRSLRRQGLLRGISVSVLPGTLSVEKGADGCEVVVLGDNELLETTVCAIPANPNALAEMRAHALSNRTTPRPTMPTATKKKSPATRAPAEEEKPAALATTEEKPEEKAAAPHDVYAEELTAAVAAVEGLTDEQRAAVQAAVDAALVAALAKVEAMEGEPPPAAEEAARSAAATATVEGLSRELAAANTRAAAAEKRADGVERVAIIQRAKDDKQWSLAMEPFLASLPLASLRAWKASAPKVVPEGEHRPPADEPADDTQLPEKVAALVTRARTGGWESLAAGEKHAITAHNPALAGRLRAASTA